MFLWKCLGLPFTHRYPLLIVCTSPFPLLHSYRFPSNFLLCPAFLVLALLIIEQACVSFLLRLSYPEMAAKCAKHGSHRSLLQQVFPCRISRETSPAPGGNLEVKNFTQHLIQLYQKGWKMQLGHTHSTRELLPICCPCQSQHMWGFMQLHPKTSTGFNKSRIEHED